MLRHGTADFTSRPKEVMLRIAIALKQIHRPGQGFNPRTLGTIASTITTRMPRATISPGNTNCLQKEK
jgi:hypothetical protein